MKSGSRDARILILTNPTDAHAFVVREALRRKGADPLIWHTTDFPSQQIGSVWLGCRQDGWDLTGAELDLDHKRSRKKPVTSVWLRRPEPPVLPPSLDPADQQFALRECMLFLRSLYQVIGSHAFWVNPLESQRRVLLKPEQLEVAMRCGFSIPKTLCSNDPDRIRQFVRANPAGVVYKSLFPVSWQTQQGVAVLFSSAISESDLPDDSILRLTPGIFQALVPKSYELRITAIGRRLFTAKLRSQEVAAATLDYRVAIAQVPLEPFNLPKSVANACLRMMDDLGLVFGCFDLIVTPSGEYVFLEVNEMGSFLWVEEQLPELTLLDAFCEFLIQASARYRWQKSGVQVVLQDVEAEASYQREFVAPQHHVTGPGASLVEP